MTLLAKFLGVLQDIHEQSFVGNETATYKKWDKRPAIVLMVTAACLLMLHYLKFNSTFYDFLNLWFSQFSDNSKVAISDFRRQTFYPLLSYVWWIFWHLMVRLPV